MSCIDDDLSHVSTTELEEDARNALLVHCGEQALAPLPEPPMELPALWHEEQGMPSGYFEVEVKAMFDEHSEGKSEMDAAATARWLSKCFSEEFGPHSTLVIAVLAENGHLGLITYPEFRELYLKSLSAGNVDAIRRDFLAHAIPTLPLPAPETPTRPTSVPNLWDECILYDNDQASAMDGESFGADSPSHLRVETLAIDSSVPRHIRDGSFMFVDEDSCIGCGNCAMASPATFKMLQSTGRARAYAQASDKDGSIEAAIQSCPVDCIKAVSFEELKLFENARENGDGRADHRHMGRSLNNGNGTPLHVSGMTSDANHRSSWYHTLKSKCSMSGSCPKKGCYDCPHFSEKGANPYFKAKNEIMEEKRLEELMETLGKEMRKRMEL